MTMMSVPPPADRVTQAGPSHLQRVTGRAKVRFGENGVSDLEQVAPARLLFPVPAPGDFPLAVTVTTAGGLTGGDRMRLEIVVDAGASATVVPQSAEKLYRARDQDPPTRIDTWLVLGAGSRCEWIGQEAILFDRSRMRRSLAIDLEGDARVLAVEMLVLGRAAMGEVFAEGLVHDSWRVRRNGRLVWADTLRLEGEFARAGGAPFGFGGATALLTMLYVGPDAERHLDLGRGIAGDLGGATAFDGMLIVRIMGPDAHHVRRAGAAATEAMRAAVFGLAPTLPRPCHC